MEVVLACTVDCLSSTPRQDRESLITDRVVANSLKINLFPKTPGFHRSHKAPKSGGFLEITCRVGFTAFPKRSPPRVALGVAAGSGKGNRDDTFHFSITELSKNCAFQELCRCGPGAVFHLSLFPGNMVLLQVHSLG